MSPLQIGIPGIAPSTATVESVVHTYGNLIYKTAYHMTGSTSDAEDVTQEVFIKLFRNWAQACSFHNLGAWIRRIVSNAALDLLRSRQARSRREKSVNDAGAVEEPGRRLDRQEFSEMVSRGIARLSPQQSTALVLFDHEGLPVKEIASIMGVAEATVRGYVGEARKRMKDYLTPYLSGNA